MMTYKHMILALAALALPALPSVAAAQDRPVELSSQIEVVRTTDDGEMLTAATSVVPGDLLQFTVSYHNNTNEIVTDFVVIAPVSRNVLLATEEAARLTVSVDGGSDWGRLDALDVAAEDGTRRPAAIEDITHLRWVIASIGPAQSGALLYRAAVK